MKSGHKSSGRLEGGAGATPEVRAVLVSLPEQEPGDEDYPEGEVLVGGAGA
jgi:hypothetical protein